MAVLYGVLSALNRTSRYGRKIFPGPNSSASSASSSAIGAYTADSYTALCAVQYALELSAASPS